MKEDLENIIKDGLHYPKDVLLSEILKDLDGFSSNALLKILTQIISYLIYKK